MSIKKVSIVKKRPYSEISEIEENFQISKKGEICLALGGDGTFLEAAKNFDCPILHIRAEEKNSLGFHADVALSHIKEVIKDLKQGTYSVDRYAKLRLTYQSKQVPKTCNVVNDIVLFRASARTIHFKVNYYDENGNELPLYPGAVRGDGMLFARQIGSTAYNYFAHGPILFDVDVVTVTPINANRTFSIVTDKDFRVTVTKRNGVLECDGVNITKLGEGDSFTITKSDEIVKVIRLKNKEKFSSKLARLESF